MSDSNLHKIIVTPNKQYDRDGTGSYVWLLKKHDLTPTTSGPYQKVAKRPGLKDKLKEQPALHMLQEHLEKAKKKADEKIAEAAPKELKRVAENGKQFDVKAEDMQNDPVYVCPVHIGTPPQAINIQLDTGTANLWSSHLPLATRVAAPHRKPPRHFFEPKKSSTFGSLGGANWTINHGEGMAVSGLAGTDTLRLGGLNIEHQAMGFAKSLSNAYQKNAGDGILGLAFGPHVWNLKPTTADTPVSNIKSHSDIPQAQEVFTCYLGGNWRDADKESPSEESFWTFGYIDQDTLKKAGVTDPHYVPVDFSRGFWEFASPSATLGGNTIMRKSGNTAIADTGTPLALVSDDLCKHIYAAIPGASYNTKHQGWTFPIATLPDQLPAITFGIGDKQFEIPKEDLGFEDIGAGMWYGSIQSRGDSLTDILGDAWLRGIYAIFDIGNSRFGAVPRVGGKA